MVREFVVGILRDLWAYLEIRLFQRPGFLWWGVSLTAGLLAYALCLLRARRAGASHGKALPVGLLVWYTTLVIAVTVMSRSVGTERGQSLIVAGGVSSLLREGYARPDWLANAVMLLPVGVLLPEVTGWGLSRTVLSCLVFSTWIEVVQYVCTLGYPELIDVMHNTLGALVGYGIWELVTAVRRLLRGRGGEGV